MQTWPLQQPTSELSEVLDRVEQQGPQIITREGVEKAVVIPITEWQRLNRDAAEPQKPFSNEDLLKVLQSGPQFDLDIPPRRSWKLRDRAQF